MLALGLCEHFVYAAEYLSGIGPFTESLRHHWEWELRISDIEPQDFMPKVLAALPTSDSDQALDMDERELFSARARGIASSVAMPQTPFSRSTMQPI